MKICCYAFAGTALFFRALIEECSRAGDDVEWSVITPQGPFHDYFDDLIPAEGRLYLYRDFDRVYRQQHPPYRWHDTPGIDSVYLALARDKNGYRHLDKEEQLRRAATITSIYREFLDRVKPDYVVLPIAEAVNGYILMNLCAEAGIELLYHIDLRILGRAMFGSDLRNTLPPYFGQYTREDLIAAKDVIAAFRAGTPKATFAKFPPSRPPKPPLLRRVFRNTWLRWRYERLHASEENLGMRIRINMVPIVRAFRRWRFQSFDARFFDIRRATDRLPPRYILYMLHKSPEASINGFAPYFVDQMRAVELLLYNMPADYSLVVKEHPASVGVRPRDFYRALRRKPGVITAHPDVSTQHLVENAAVVVTATGTIGLECYIMGKPCLLIGPVFFSHLCYHLDAWDGLTNQLRDIVNSHAAPKEEDREIEIAKLLNLGSEFIINDPWFVPGVCAPDNIAAARAEMWRTIRRRRECAARRPPERLRVSG